MSPCRESYPVVGWTFTPVSALAGKPAFPSLPGVPPGALPQRGTTTAFLQGESARKAPRSDAPSSPWKLHAFPEGGFWFPQKTRGIETGCCSLNRACVPGVHTVKKQANCLLELKRTDGLGNGHGSNSHQLPPQIKLCH